MVFVLIFLQATTVGSLMQRSLVPVWERYERLRVGLSDTAQVLTRSKLSLVQENETLRQQYGVLAPAIFQLEMLQNKVDELEAVLHRGEVESVKTIAAVVAPARKNLYQNIIIDQGSIAGVVVGDKVLADTMLIGEVSRVYPKSAMVELYSRHEGVVDGILPDGTAVELLGEGVGNYSIELIRGVEINKGDIIYDRSFRGHILAVVDEVIFDPRDPYQQVLVRVPINLNTLRWVIVAPRVTSEDREGMNEEEPIVLKKQQEDTGAVEVDRISQ
ncbi:MAG: cell shape-determining protein MreC [Planctomycetota bacterium]|jgi:cell shape-determining protein MreC